MSRKLDIPYTIALRRTEYEVLTQLGVCGVALYCPVYNQRTVLVFTIIMSGFLRQRPGFFGRACAL
jgi:hypothetical protein